ncbi:uncharacterized protein BcabD6B2_06500 [Babesia caballi]|uniref:Uncharacterized protein n=1 Tax=Babesia caballi TaxID=5871 RepID=A0AAV4LP09_BABCB|nr:hypothetical protein, conserved [Babesia caballi]
MNMTEKPAYYSLTKEPTDLKEAVDWMFIGYDSGKKIGSGGIGKEGEIKKPDEINAYTPAYYGSSWAFGVEIGVEWSKKINKRKAIQCFFIAIQHIYEGLTELYYNCKKDWKNENLGGTSGEGLKQFMEKNGFDTAKLKTSMKGEEIISQALQGLNEFDKAYIATGPDPSLDAFRFQLEQNAWSNPSGYPLSVLYILATYAYVQSSSPATPSFAGYSGTAVLAGGAYGLNLGGLGTLMSALLA